MLYLLAQDVPSTDLGITDVLMWPVAMTLLAWIIFFLGWRVENRLTKAPWKWIALVPLAYGLYVGFIELQNILDPFYRAQVGVGSMKKMIAAHWGGFFIPVIGLLGIVLFHFFNHKLNLPTDED